MKVYLASSFNLSKKVEEIALKLEEENVSIDYDWWRHFDHKKIAVHDNQWYDLDEIRDIYLQATNAIREADAFVLVGPKGKPKKFNGANVELGYALALGKPCWHFGKVERSALYCDVKPLANVSQLMEERDEKI